MCSRVVVFGHSAGLGDSRQTYVLSELSFGDRSVVTVPGSMWRNLLSVFLAVTLGVFSTPSMAHGQDEAADPQQQGYPQNWPQPQDPNAQDTAGDEQHGVARLSIVQGDVNVKRGDNNELVAAVTNAPVMMQDRLQTSPGSRAEVELDYANLIRLAPNTDLGFADLQYRHFQVQLGAGTIIYRVLRDSSAQAEVDTPSIAFRPEGQGEYRIAVLEDGATQITVRSGQAEIFSERGSQRLSAGRTVLVRGNPRGNPRSNPSDPEFQAAYDLPRDQFDDWSATRDRGLLASRSYANVSRDIYGADDLDAYGNWVPSQYGQVWEPRTTASDWSPYSDGEWSWQPYYGWTWVDSAPWGWAPYHYGRWFWNGGHRWCWWPGAVGARYLWSPAQVGFFGVVGGVGLGFAGLGWVALAPFEVGHPWWGRYGDRDGYGYGGYGRGDVRSWRGANITAMYRNAAIRGGAMTAGYNGFDGPHRRFSPATRAQLGGASLFYGQVPVSPTRTSYQFSGRQANSNPRLASAGSRQFFYHQQPRTGVNGYGGFRGAEQASGGSYAPPTTPSGGGWQRFGDPGTGSVSGQGFGGTREQSGWHHFGAASPSAPEQGNTRSYDGGYTPQSFGGSRPSYGDSSTPRYSAPPSSFHGGGERGGSHDASRGGHSSSGGHHGR